MFKNRRSVVLIDLEQIVETKWNANNKALYVSRGYVYTKMFDKLYVHAKDLPIHSMVRVKYTCDICGKQLSGRYGEYNKSKDSLCCACAVKIAKVNYRGSNSQNWKGGITELYTYLRLQLSSWIHQQLERANYQCELTGKRGVLNVHHMYSFSNIVKDTLEELQLDIRPSCGDYSKDELQLLVVNFIKNNDLKAKPIVMLESVHKDFHKFCGGCREETTLEQLEEFKKTLLDRRK